MSALDELKAKVKTSYIEECIIWALKTDADKTAAIAELSALRSERDALKELLKQLEWGYESDIGDYCPSCKGNKRWGKHLQNCKLAAALTGNE